jgi:hypothetical protein
MAPQRLRLLGRVTLEQAHALSTRLGHDAPLDEYLLDPRRPYALR